MTRQYLRTVRVAIGDDAQETSTEGLLIAFDVRREASPAPASGTISIYNFSHDTERRIHERGTRFRLWAGYTLNPPLIADGDVRRVERVREGLDRITRIHFGGNALAQTQFDFEATYEGVVTVREVITDIVAVMEGFELGSLDLIPEDAQVEDLAFAGPARTALTARLRPLGVEWYEDAGVIRFSTVDTSADDRAGREVVVISEATGMIGSPGTTDDGIRVKTLLDPRIGLDTRFRVESEVLQDEGDWKVVTVTHRGDNREGEFVTEIEARPADQGPAP